MCNKNSAEDHELRILITQSNMSEEVDKAEELEESKRNNLTKHTKKNIDVEVSKKIPGKTIGEI